jgi:hypothetical protein
MERSGKTILGKKEQLVQRPWDGKKTYRIEKGSEAESQDDSSMTR